ncbi:MAG: glycosyltransferase family 25 protein [Blastocatellia bacterium]|nr:glycosyltransferase family 25 protein [Blastocatellia bacterium]
MLSPALKSIHDAVYVLTISRAEDRQENVRTELGEGNFEFVYGVDKRDVSLEQFVSDGIYDEALARRTDRRNKAMTLGHICCSLGHRMIYEKFLESGAERALIFEDDVVRFAVDEVVIAEMVAAVPEDADLIYWGWEGGGYRPAWGGVKIALYHVQHALGLLRYNHTMIRNLYSQPYNDHFDVAGKHFLAHSYTVNRRAAEALLKWNTPVKLNADNALIYAVMNVDVRGYLARKQLFGQRSADKNDPMATLTA